MSNVLNLQEDSVAQSVSLPRSLLVAIQKGGSYKSSIVANVGAAIAAKGRRVLLVDADQQGNLAMSDLGVRDEDWDRGASLAATFQYGTPLKVVKNVRPNLDLVMGGLRLGVVSVAAAATVDPPDMAENLRSALVELQAENEYDLILFDSGHGDRVLLVTLLEVCSDLIIPTQEDDSSMLGIEQLAISMKYAAKRGSKAKLMGVVIVDVDASATLRLQHVVDEIRQILDGTDVEPFNSTIRHAKGMSIAMRKYHLTAQEVVATLETEGGSRSVRLGEARVSDNQAVSLANDYQSLTREILQRLSRTPSGEDPR